MRSPANGSHDGQIQVGGQTLGSRAPVHMQRSAPKITARRCPSLDPRPFHEQVRAACQKGWRRGVEAGSEAKERRSSHGQQPSHDHGGDRGGEASNAFRSHKVDSESFSRICQRRARESQATPDTMLCFGM
jgi:hypothetical protein